jgi:hypothetical protein
MIKKKIEITININRAPTDQRWYVADAGIWEKLGGTDHYCCIATASDRSKSLALSAVESALYILGYENFKVRK